MKRLTEDSYFARSLAWVARVVCRYPRAILIGELLLFVLSILITVVYPGIEFDTSRDNLVGANKKYHQNFLRFKKEFPQQDDLVVVVESEDPEKNRQFVERLGARLDTETNLFTDVFYKGDLRMLGSKALLFVPDSDLEDLKDTLRDYRPFIGQFCRTTNLVSFFDMINTQFRTASREKNAETESLLKAVPALNRIVSQAADSMNRPGAPPSPGITALFGAGEQAEQQVYITFANGRIFLVTAHALTEDLNPDAVKRLRDLVAETAIEVPGLNVGITGEPVLEHDEMAQSQKDTTVASIASLTICALIFIYGYQETGRPVKATLCLLVGLAYTMAFATLTVGHLNILTITFVPMLIGLAIDFGVHLITRYEEELRHGRTKEQALTTAIVFTGQGICTGAFTTAGAFLAMGFTNFKGIQEMGIICGGGLLVCLVPMMSLLPVLLLQGRQNVLDHNHTDLEITRARIESAWLQRPILVGAATAVLCLLAGLQIHKVYFDYNLLNMQSAGLPAVEFEEKLINASTNSTSVTDTNNTGKSVLFGAVIATNLDQAVLWEDEIKKLPAVADVDSVAKFLHEDQTRKLAIIGQMKDELQGIQFHDPDLRPVNIPELSRTLYSLRGYLGAARDEVGTNDPALSSQLLSLRDEVERLRKTMLRGDGAERELNERKLFGFQQALFDDLRETFESLRAQDNSAPLRIPDLPKALRDRFIGVTGTFLLQVYPKKDVWQRENQREFIDQVEKIDPNVTGTPVQLYHYTELLKDSYVQAAEYSLAAIVVLVFIHFRSIGSVVLSLLPVAVGSLWLGGLMGYFGIPLNPANIMTLPLVLGIGVTNGIQILNRFAEEQTPGILARSTGKAVFVSGLTAIAGFGSLILAKHRGIQSLGYVMAAGITTCMIAALTFLPALLNLILRIQKRHKSANGIVTDK